MNASITAASIILAAAAVTGGAVLANSKQILLIAADEFAGTPLGDTLVAAQDQAAPVRRMVRSGDSFMAVLDACPFEDEGWQGDADPLGRIKCGEAYQIRLDPAARSWVATGKPDEDISGAPGPITTARTPDNMLPMSNRFGIWGAVFEFDATSRVFTEEGTLVGYVRRLSPEELAAEEARRNQSAVLNTLEKSLRTASRVNVVFDACPMSDEGWEGDKDPFGTIKCGETYALRFLPKTNEWEATGFNEASGSAITATAPAAPKGEHMVVIWGATFLIDPDRNVLYGAMRLGRIEISEPLK